ncbi:MAG: pyridoxal 5'-phosphate synthase glutaminase subunit PdxT [Gaiellales bacterium]
MIAAPERPCVGVLAMQGAFAEHIRMLESCGAMAIEVGTSEQLRSVDALVIPGGESTAIRKALDRSGLLELLRERIADGMPVLGTCAGMIVLADTAPDGAPACLAALDIEVERNGFGRQVHSFEAPISYGDDRAEQPGVFIRAPRIGRIGPGVEVIARLCEGPYAGEPVAVAQPPLLAATYHPELSGDTTLHARLIVLASAR